MKGEVAKGLKVEAREESKAHQGNIVCSKSNSMSISDFLYHHEGTYKNQLKSHEDLEKDLQSEPRNHYLEN